MGATRARGPGPEPGLDLAELEAVCVWTARRLRALTRAARVGGGYDPDVFDIALLTHRAARAGAAAWRARARDQPARARTLAAQPAGHGVPSGAEEGARMTAHEPDVVRWLLVGAAALCAVLAGLAQRRWWRGAAARPGPAAHP
jgi:hypothetical protein